MTMTSDCQASGVNRKAMALLNSQFAHIKKFHAQQGARVVARVLPGEYYVTAEHEVISTVLGSCISACIHDPVLKIGGMNHFMLPSGSVNSSWSTGESSVTNRFGNFAMESLINDLLKAGADKKRLEVKIFGGGRILEAMTDIGHRNSEFVKDYLTAEKLNVISQDIGDIFPRKVNYYPDSGKVRVKKLKALYSQDIARREQELARDIETKPVSGDMELF